MSAVPTGTARMQEQSFVFHLTPTQANDMAYNRDVSGGKTDYSVQVSSLADCRGVRVNCLIFGLDGKFVIFVIVWEGRG